ncbi:Endoglucanase 9 [Hibiscus syriacus]|uniref:Endoglucanase n=1 Tax=Hibiscus syriacus TaxID=106335 RepID=A0A6A2YXW4_HIBSY|nr:Endoglucanase 9 [Hibiscus syriacus]
MLGNTVGVEGNLDYKDALLKSLLFFQGQRSGALPAKQQVSWRSNSGLSDGSLDHNGSTITRGKDCNSLGHRYLLKCATATPGKLYVGVGDPNVDHRCWQSPEDMCTDRAVYSVSPSNSSSDVAGEMAAALAAASMVFRKLDSKYSKLLLQTARKVMAFSIQYRGVYSDSLGSAVCPFYCSYSAYNDELLRGASWLLRATNDAYYYNFLKTLGANDQTDIFNWDNKYAGTYVFISMLALLDKDKNFVQFKQQAESFMCKILPDFPYSTSKYAQEPLHCLPWQPSSEIGCDAGFQPYFYSSNPNPNVLVGAIVGGPDQNDGFTDDQSDFSLSEPATYINAAFVGPDMLDSGVGYSQGRVSTLELPFRYYVELSWKLLSTIFFVVKLKSNSKHLASGSESSSGSRYFDVKVKLDLKTSLELYMALRREVEPGNLISFVVKLKSNLKSNLEIDDACVHNSLRREVETAGGSFFVKLSLVKLKSNRPFVVKLSLCCLESNILHYDLKLALKLGNPFVVKLSLKWHDILHRGVEIVDVWYDILRRGVKITDGPFVVKLSLDLNIIRREVEIQVLYVLGGHDSLCREVETVDDPFVVKFGFELDILRCEVEIYSRANYVVSSPISFTAKLELALVNTCKVMHICHVMDAMLLGMPKMHMQHMLFWALERNLDLRLHVWNLDSGILKF